jgi:hypothetical protein
MVEVAPSTARTILRSSWYAIGLGLLFEGLQLGALRAGGGELPAELAILADSVQKVSWSSLICVALAAGTATTRASASTMAGVGLIAAPLAFGAARALHKSAALALDIGAPSGGPNPWLMAGIKAFEYAVFGYVITRLIRRPELRLPAYLRTGLMIGVVFGALMIWLMDRAAPGGLNTPTLLARSVNEVLFPVGCASLLWVTNIVARRTS